MVRLGFENWLFISQSENYTIMCPSSWLIPGWGDSWDGLKWLCFFHEPMKKQIHQYLLENCCFTRLCLLLLQAKRIICVCVCVCVCACACVGSRVWLCDPIDCSPPGSSVHGMSQARILEWAALSSYRGSSWSRDWTHVSWVSFTGSWILYHCTTWQATYPYIPSF